MSVMVPAAEFDFAIAWSEFVNAFNRADLAVRARLIALKGKPQPLLGPNIDALLKTPAGPQYPKAEKSRIDQAAEELRRLKQMRCDLVHGIMERLVIAGIPHGLFQNVQVEAPFGRQGLLITLAELDLATKTLKRSTAILRPKDPENQPAPCLV